MGVDCFSLSVRAAPGNHEEAEGWVFSRHAECRCLQHDQGFLTVTGFFPLITLLVEKKSLDRQNAVWPGSCLDYCGLII